MANLMSFVVNTGTREGDQYEIARYQQYYHAQGVALAAEPQPQGGFLLTTYQSQSPPTQYAPAAHASTAQYATAAQYAAAAQYAPAMHAPAAQYAPGAQHAAMQHAVPAPAIAPQPLVAVAGSYGPPPEPPAFSTQHGFGTPQQYGGVAPGAQQAPAWSAPEQQAPARGAPEQQAPPWGPPEQQAPPWSPPEQPGGMPRAGYGMPQPPGAGGQPWAPSPQHPNPAPVGAYGQGFDAAAPGAAPGGAYAVPAAPRKKHGAAFGSLGWLQMLKFAGTGIVVLALAGWSFFLLRKAQSNIVLFENSLDVPGELSLSGKSYGSISPRQALRLELDSGNYEVSFAGNGTKLDGGTLTVPKGNSTIGYRAVYNLGGRKGLAVVTKYYGGAFEDRVATVAEGTRVIEVPGAQSLDRIDDGFPDTITVPKHASYGTVVRVCHVDEAKGTVGCPGW